ncbi:right-handed parallel beta-helix repeat-containing protein [Komagataeibacter saccharivorans]|uniref:right-handed parallel beta-helix repeat-containing protein n=1 Tax=Komagataeibacter saccharivorans TaxID=265959 RepID=UPI00215594BB|nr:right-handed parallel beta-helix repeat-containing protein [Komagataeibacter saccharivorans]
MVKSAGTADSVAAWLGKKMDVSGGTADSPTLNGGVESYTPTDKPGSAGTSIPNTIWVDDYYQPRNTFISAATTWTVCASGCTYSSPLDAWNAALNANFLNGAWLTISIADGTYNLGNQFFTNVTKTQYVRVVGNTATPANVVLNFTNTKGTNLGGFSAYSGGRIGMIDGVTIQAPTDGTGSLSSTDSLGRHIWNNQSYGAGIQAYGAGSSIAVGAHMVIHGLYYSMVADNNGGIDAPQGGVSMSLAGDVNAMARGGGVIVCTPCTATDASDYTDPDIQLGSNYDAERGGSLYIDGSTGSKSLISGIVGLTGGHIWAHNTTFTGSLIAASGQGAWITGNASAEFTGCNISGYNIGVNAVNGGYAAVDTCRIHNNIQSGITADGGRVTGSSATIADNTTYGIQALHQGSVVMFGTYASMSGNGTNFSVQAAGVESTSGTSYTASSMDVQ